MSKGETLGAIDHETDLRPSLQKADPGVLLAILVQLSGDTTLLEELAGSITHVADPPEFRGQADDATRELIIERLLQELRERAIGGVSRGEVMSSVVWDPAVSRRIFELGLGQAVSDEYVPLLLEQAGFQEPQPVIPITRPIPAETKVAIIGAGLAGIAGALAARRAGVEFEIFERNADLGGTWLTQVYPGVGVDTPAAYYSLSTDLNPEWSSYYPKGGEYQQYLRAVDEQHSLRRHVRFETEVEELRWDEEQNLWHINLVSKGRRWSTTATFVITAAGYLNRVKYPDWAGRESFAGLSVHSGEWSGDIDLTGKKVAVVGTGCTAVQIVDALVDDVDALTVVQRQPHWVAPRRRPSDDVPDEDQVLLRELPLYAQWRRLKSFWGSSDNAYPVVIVDPEWASEHVSISPANDLLMQDCLSYIDRTFGGGTEMARKLTPNFAPFGKRIIRDPGGYYEALTRAHVGLETDPIRSVDPRGLIASTGELIELDAIIYATGYTLDFLSTLDIRGRGGKTLVEEWEGNPRAYRGGMVPDFPNLFITSAPNQNPSHGAGNNFGIEVALHYIFECIQLMAERGARTIEPTREAYDSYVERIDDDMLKTVWRHSDHAHTYYRNETGRVIVASPWRLVDVWHEHRVPDEDHLVLGKIADSTESGPEARQEVGINGGH